MCLMKRLFQFTPLREGRPHRGRFNPDALYFNSRPSARGDLPPRPANAPKPVISIHAPPRGATQADQRRKPVQAISIHAPPRGATLRRSPCSPPSSNFNSRPSARGDDAHRHKAGDVHAISIHAPPRGATDDPGQRYAHQQISIHAPPRGATNPLLPPMRLQIISIHAPPRGATKFSSLTVAQRGHFNSRPSARGD